MVIIEWPSRANLAWKVPSTIAYASENPNLHDDQWGYAVSQGAKSYTWTKLLMDMDVQRRDDDNPSMRAMYDSYDCSFLCLPPDKSATDVCEDYLRGIYKYLVDYLTNRYRCTTVQLTPIECWITVPAIWSNNTTRDHEEGRQQRRLCSVRLRQRQHHSRDRSRGADGI
jgi:hypothetical protein